MQPGDDCRSGRPASTYSKGRAMTQKTSSYIAEMTTSPFLLTLLTTPGSPALRTQNSELPCPIQVDETAHREVTRRLGAGVQVYDRDADGTFQFREPQADLYDLETLVSRGIHFVGPQARTAQWADADGSRVIARVVEAVDAPLPSDPTKDIELFSTDWSFGGGQDECCS